MYPALAIELDGLVVTADRRFVKRVADTGYTPQVMWIEDLPTP